MTTVKRETVALAAVIVGAAGLLSLHALPWLAVSTSRGTDFMSFHELQEGGGVGGEALAGMALGLSFVFHAFLWGSVIMAVAYAGLLLRPVQRQLGEAIATVGVVAVASSIFFVLGAFFFAVNVGKMDDALVVGDAWYGINYLAPAFMLAFVGLAAWHSVASYPHARDALTHHTSVPIRTSERVATAPSGGESEADIDGPRVL